MHVYIYINMCVFMCVCSSSSRAAWCARSLMSIPTSWVVKAEGGRSSAAEQR